MIASLPWAVMWADQRRAQVEDVHEAAAGMPNVTVGRCARADPVYRVGGKPFVFFRAPQADAVDPVTGERYDDVIVLRVGSETDKRALLWDPTLPFFTTSHFDGHPSVLVRASRLGELTVYQLHEIVQDAWVAQTSRRRGEMWLRQCADG